MKHFTYFWMHLPSGETGTHKNTFVGGWSVQEPGGSTYHAKTDIAMVRYVRDY